MIPAYPSLQLGSDRLEHKLLNLTWAWLQKDSSLFDISFMFDADIKKHEVIPYEALRNIAPELPALLEDLAARFDPASQEFLDILRATFAHMFSAYVDLGGTGALTSQYPYLSHITSIRSSSESNFFTVTGYSFFMSSPGKTGLAYAVLLPGEHISIASSSLDRIWPGSANVVRSMEAIGYSDEQIVKTLTEGLPELRHGSSLADIVFD